MKLLNTLVLFFSCALMGCTHLAKDKSPSVENKEWPVYYDTQVVAGQCLGQLQAGTFGAGLAAAAIKQGVNEFAQALALAANGYNDMAVAQSLMETTRAGFGNCIYVVRGWFYRSVVERDYLTMKFNSTEVPAAFPTAAEFYTIGLTIAAPPDFFFQGQLFQSIDGTKNFIKPVSALLNNPIKTITARTEKRTVDVLISIAEQQADLAKSPGTKVSLGDMKQGEESKFPKSPCRAWIDKSKNPHAGCPNVENYDDLQIASAGTPRTIPSSEPKVASITFAPFISGWFATPLGKEALKPIYVQAGIVETLGPSPFLQFVSNVFTGKKDDITTALQNAVIPSYSDAAKLAERKNQDALSKAFNSSLKDARAALTSCAKATANPDDRRDAGDKLRALLSNAMAADRDTGAVNDRVITMVESDKGSAVCEALAKTPPFL